MDSRFGALLLRLAAALIALPLAGCFHAGGLPERSGAQAVDTATADPVRSRIVFTALQMVGVPYRYGGEAPDGFDCSGLVQYAYRHAGLSVPRTSREQLKASRPVALDEAHPGDLLFFRSRDYSHVGIYVGEGRFVHAPATNRTVSIGSLAESYYRSHFVRAGRLTPL
jgi:cell wall-associated NlpC family hydrolase